MPGDWSNDQEVPLFGGNVTGGVVRVGQTVRRRRGPWSTHVHAFLRYLEDVGFPASPRYLGVDEAGREILTFHEGTTTHSVPDLFAADERLEDVLRLVRQFHDAASDYRPDKVTIFWEGTIDPEGGPLMLHGDLGPWNLVLGPSGYTIIDWDAASPGRPEWELAYVLHTFVPLWPDANAADAETVRRLRIAADGYGLSRDRLSIALRLIPLRCRRISSSIRNSAAGGRAAFRQMLVEGHDVTWERGAGHVETRLATWLRMLGV